ncbi:nucleotidyltransferase domain-containing protein [Desulfogranum japonicum]|uniref:nucleotidyltransferase domain-containing protein n=1 Tax=Desulfogranum japonicum TaxID=231447 RepID=UPI00040DD6C3|nr:nucleotidyltransferase domain-containing protein [Desulfogranum japonicum]
MISEKIQTTILDRLRAAEVEHNVTILYACESGSRAWGFASEDSDYDVRFIYAHRPEWYLSFDVEYRRDVIEYPIVDEIDCGGWDIRKALYLFTRTNGALIEWLNSPIRYIEKNSFAEQLRNYAPQVMNRLALQYHYSHMARRNAREPLFQDTVKLKKYFYVLRSLLALRFIEAYGTPPPVEFEKLVQSVAPAAIHSDIYRLLDSKRNAPEVSQCASVPVINDFIQKELEQYANTFSGQGRPDLLDKREIRETLNSYFQEAVGRL